MGAFYRISETPLLILLDERDVFMSRENQVELMDRMAMVEVNLPQVFVNGQYLGDADVIEKLNETGELRKILRPYKSLTVTTVCGKCGGFRNLPCPICDGSKKSMHRNDFTENSSLLGAQFVTIVDLSNVINVNDANKDSFEIK